MTAPRSAAVIVAAMAALSSAAAAAELTSETLAAWERYVTQTERRIKGGQPPAFATGLGPLDPSATRLDGSMIDVPRGTIHHWRGSALARGVTVDQVVRALTRPGSTGSDPHAWPAGRTPDVRESRVLARSDDTLSVYLLLERRAIVTVVYDTEHLVTFTRHSPQLATSRSIATRIAEVGGGDRGFLWRLNSYWRYTQAGSHVRIDVESISLSRDVPRLVRPVAEPIVTRIARESLARTLSSVQTFLETGSR